MTQIAYTRKRQIILPGRTLSLNKLTLDTDLIRLTNGSLGCVRSSYTGIVRKHNEEWLLVLEDESWVSFNSLDLYPGFIFLNI